MLSQQKPPLWREIHAAWRIWGISPFVPCEASWFHAELFGRVSPNMWQSYKQEVIWETAILLSILTFCNGSIISIRRWRHVFIQTRLTYNLLVNWKTVGVSHSLGGDSWLKATEEPLPKHPNTGYTCDTQGNFPPRARITVYQFERTAVTTLNV